MFLLTTILLLLGCVLAWYFGRQGGLKDGEILAFKKTAYWVARARENERHAEKKVRGLEYEVANLKHSVEAWRKNATEFHPDKTIDELEKLHKRRMEIQDEQKRRMYAGAQNDFARFSQMMMAQQQGMYGLGYTQGYSPSFLHGLFPWWP